MVLRTNHLPKGVLMKSNACIITIADIAAELCADSVRVLTVAELREQDAREAELDALYEEWMSEMLGEYNCDRETYNWLRNPKNWDAEFYGDVFKDFYGFRPWQSPQEWWG